MRFRWARRAVFLYRAARRLAFRTKIVGRSPGSPPPAPATSPRGPGTSQRTSLFPPYFQIAFHLDPPTFLPLRQIGSPLQVLSQPRDLAILLVNDGLLVGDGGHGGPLCTPELAPRPPPP